MNFASDNWAGAHPAIAEALTGHAGGFARAYGASDLDRCVAERFSEIFEKQVAVFYVATGTAANALALTSVTRPGGVAFCHREAHLVEDECGAAEYFGDGLRLAKVDGALGRMDPAKLEQVIARYPAEFIHSGRPIAVSVTQATEVGTVYPLAELDAIAAIAKQNGLAFHMDGARFANALVALGVTPAEMTWKRGLDMLSFGGTKNGCWCAEAVILFDPDRAAEFAFVHKRAAQLFSKARFVSAQFDAYLRDGHWLATARHANAMAARLADRVRASARARLGWEPQANEVFAVLKTSVAARLDAAGARFYEWHAPDFLSASLAPDERLYRFVTSFATTEVEVDRFAEMIA